MGCLKPVKLFAGVSENGCITVYTFRGKVTLDTFYLLLTVLRLHRAAIYQSASCERIIKNHVCIISVIHAARFHRVYKLFLCMQPSSA